MMAQSEYIFGNQQCNTTASLLKVPTLTPSNISIHLKSCRNGRHGPTSSTTSTGQSFGSGHRRRGRQGIVISKDVEESDHGKHILHRLRIHLVTWKIANELEPKSRAASMSVHHVASNTNETWRNCAPLVAHTLMTFPLCRGHPPRMFSRFQNDRARKRLGMHPYGHTTMSSRGPPEETHDTMADGANLVPTWSEDSRILHGAVLQRITKVKQQETRTHHLLGGEALLPAECHRRRGHRHGAAGSAAVCLLRDLPRR